MSIEHRVAPNGVTLIHEPADVSEDFVEAVRVVVSQERRRVLREHLDLQREESAREDAPFRSPSENGDRDAGA